MLLCFNQLERVLSTTRYLNLMSQSIPTGYIPRETPGISLKDLPGGRDLAFENSPGAGNSTRTGILWKMKLKLQKNSMDHIFKGESKRKVESLTFFEVHTVRVFSMEFFLVCGSIFWFCCHAYLTKSLRSWPWLVYLKFSLGYGNILSVYWFY